MGNTTKFNGQTPKEYIELVGTSPTSNPAGILINAGKLVDNLLFRISRGEKDHKKDAEELIKFYCEVAEIILPKITPEERREFVDVFTSPYPELVEKYEDLLDMRNYDKITAVTVLEVLKESRDLQLRETIAEVKDTEGRIPKR